ncbi:MAG: hypothetical protein RMK78_04795 [Thermaurantiacus sp.]|uniref:hypothetical protein n=1 Tax=Thermaurantiacus sp. TaxID=2820283 RepID=UPI00298F2F86|nr:hypothetical protein [Thermaurantiacus sp.]MDW8414773.1 hypothetical protein [Thermaurantiacus sp.]
MPESTADSAPTHETRTASAHLPLVADGRPSAGTVVPRLALCLGVLVLLLDQATATWRLVKIRDRLAERHATQAELLKQAARFEAQLEGLAAGTALLAQSGNPNAAAIVATLEREGIRIKSDGVATR